jgi:hypothetical protein
MFVQWPHDDNSEGITFSVPVKGSIISIFHRPFSERMTGGTVKRPVFRSVLQMNTNLCSPSLLIWYKNWLERFPFAAIMANLVDPQPPGAHQSS